MLAVIGFAIAGTLFIIPTAGEVPIVQSLMAFGLGIGPGVALLMTLPEAMFSFFEKYSLFLMKIYCHLMNPIVLHYFWC
ncbi:hypothetical protein [Desulfosporosinus sp. FKB]|uniref:hypothetical protein n=1 Tax=Desulfosporosinus sp. FKB TaxID=1969835 RepID=UPI001FA8A6A1|nr:hypothetical protein [Desulfosporosinus sp. FKB]